MQTNVFERTTTTATEIGASLHNAIDSAAARYMDIIDRSLRLVRILGRR